MVVDQPVSELSEKDTLLGRAGEFVSADREEFSETRSEDVQTVAERFQAAGTDLSTTTQHDLGGELTIHDAPADASGAPR